ncbi:MAG: hypothetical protein ABEN55_15490 [Bradymonadaceae bacterium]
MPDEENATEPVSNTITLPRGYVDHEGERHREITLRAPTIGDELAGTRELREQGYDPDGTSAAIGTVKQCIERWEGIADVQLFHLFQLTRQEGRMLVNRMNALEQQLVEGIGTDGEGEGNEPASTGAT